jgi:hypothetical protein
MLVKGCYSILFGVIKCWWYYFCFYVGRLYSSSCLFAAKGKCFDGFDSVCIELGFISGG